MNFKIWKINYELWLNKFLNYGMMGKIVKEFWNGSFQKFRFMGRAFVVDIFVSSNFWTMNISTQNLNVSVFQLCIYDDENGFSRAIYLFSKTLSKKMSVESG